MNRVMTIQGDRLVEFDDLSLSYISDRMEQAAEQHMPRLRADGIGPGEQSAVTMARALTRQWAAETALSVTEGRRTVRVDAADLATSMGRAAGYVRREGQGTEHPSVRADSYYQPRALLGTGFEGIEQNSRPMDLQEMLPVKQIEPWASEYVNEYQDLTGSAVIYQGRANDIPEVDVNVDETKHPMVWLVVRKRMDWSDAPSYSRSTINVDERKTAAAYRSLAYAYERMLIGDLPGSPVPGLAQLPIPETVVDLTGGLTLEQQVEAMAVGLESLRAAHDYEGEGYTTAMLDPRIEAVFRQQVSTDNPLISGRTILEGKFGEYGIASRQTRRLPASRKGAGWHTMYVYTARGGASLGQYGQLSRPVGVSWSPLSTAQYHGTDMIIGGRVGGLALPRPVDAGLIHVRVS